LSIIFNFALNNDSYSGLGKSIFSGWHFIAYKLYIMGKCTDINSKYSIAQQIIFQNSQCMARAKVSSSVDYTLVMGNVLITSNSSPKQYFSENESSINMLLAFINPVQIVHRFLVFFIYYGSLCWVKI